MTWTVESWYAEAKSEAESRRALTQSLADIWFKTLQRGMPEASREEIGQRVIEFDRQRMDAVPDLKKYPELRGMRELMTAAHRGLRDGAGLSETDAAAIRSAATFYHRFISGGRKPSGSAKAQCSYVYFPTSEVGPILANNLDSSPEEKFGEPHWPAASEHLIFGGVSSGVFFDELSPEIFPAPVHKLVARYCRNTDEAVEMFTRYNLFWGPGNMLVVDREHKLAMVEKSSCRIGVRRGEGFGFITAMTQQHPEMRAYVRSKRAESLVRRNLPNPCHDTIYWDAQDRRGDLMTQLLEEAKAKPSVEALRKIIQFRDPKRGNVAGNGEVLSPGGPPSEHTLRTSLWLLREGRAMWWARDEQTGKPSFENRMPDVTFENVWRWD